MANLPDGVHNIAMRLAGLLLAFLACLENADAQGSAVQGSARAIELLRDAEIRLVMDDYGAAASRFEQSYNWEPGFEAAFSAGYCHFKLKKFPEAELWLQRARQRDPDSERAAVYLASAQIANHKPRRAIELLEEFVGRHPNAGEAAATLAAIRSDLSPLQPAARTASALQVFLVALTALSMLLFFASLRADNPGIREAGKGLGLMALASFCLLTPFPVLLGLGGYAWAACRLQRGYHLLCFLKKGGAWAALMRSQLYKFAGAFVAAGGGWEAERVAKALNGLVRAGLDRETVRAVEAQLQVAPSRASEADDAIEEFTRADRLIREILLRLLAAMALQLGYGENEKRLLAGFAAALRLQYCLADLVAEWGGEPEGRARPPRAPTEAASEADPLFPYFQILEVPPSATRSQVKSSYRRQAKRCHPDVISHLGAEFQVGAAEQFLRIQRAYETVCRARGWEQ